MTVTPAGPGVWQSLRRLPAPRQSFPMVSLGDKIYILGGALDCNDEIVMVPDYDEYGYISRFIPIPPRTCKPWEKMTSSVLVSTSMGYNWDLATPLDTPRKGQ